MGFIFCGRVAFWAHCFTQPSGLSFFFATNPPTASSRLALESQKKQSYSNCWNARRLKIENYQLSQYRLEMSFRQTRPMRSSRRSITGQITTPSIMWPLGAVSTIESASAAAAMRARSYEPS